MLTIRNIEKLFRQEIGEWRISRIETYPNTYLIHLRKPNGEKHQIHIERNPIGDNEYEMWTWKGNIGDPQNYKPERLIVKKDCYKTMNDTLARINLLLM